jgi:hypothetical protein
MGFAADSTTPASSDLYPHIDHVHSRSAPRLRLRPHLLLASAIAAIAGRGGCDRLRQASLQIHQSQAVAIGVVDLLASLMNSWFVAASHTCGVTLHGMRRGIGTFHQ